MKKYLLLLLVISVGLFISSCEDSSTSPEPEAKASIILDSSPSGAQIWVTYPNSTTPQNKGNTPDSVVSLDAGDYTITLKLDGYKDTSWTVTLLAGQVYTKTVTLSTNLITTNYGPIRLWETTGTSSAQPSGLDLSTGQAVSSSNAAADLMYETNSTFTVHRLVKTTSKNTFFKTGTGTDLTDGTDSPVKDASWANEMSDTETKYVYIYDNDNHYSKLKIVNASSLLEVPAWVEVQYIYNGSADDKRF